MDANITRLAKKLAKTSGHVGYVAFLAHASVPGAQPMYGAPSRTQADAEAKIREALQSPSFTKGWIVSHEGIVEVS